MPVLKKSLLVLSILALILMVWGCSSEDEGNGKTQEADQDLTDSADTSDFLPEAEEEPTITDGDEETTVCEQDCTDTTTEEDVVSEEVEIEEAVLPCGGSCPEGTICHEELNGGTCLPNCNEGDGELVGDAFCQAQEVRNGFNPFDYECRPDGQCVLNEFGTSCKAKAEEPAENSVIDCGLMCEKLGQCIQWEFCEFNCNIGTYEFRDEFAQAFEQCIEQTEGCGPDEYNGALDQYCFEQAMQQAGIPDYVNDGCDQLNAFLVDTCDVPPEDAQQMLANCTVIGASLKREFFDQMVSCASGFCEDFQKCMAQSNCLFTRQY